MPHPDDDGASFHSQASTLVVPESPATRLSDVSLDERTIIPPGEPIPPGNSNWIDDIQLDQCSIGTTYGPENSGGEPLVEDVYCPGSLVILAPDEGLLIVCPFKDRTRQGETLRVTNLANDRLLPTVAGRTFHVSEERVIEGRTVSPGPRLQFLKDHQYYVWTNATERSKAAWHDADKHLSFFSRIA